MTDNVEEIRTRINSHYYAPDDDRFILLAEVDRLKAVLETELISGTCVTLDQPRPRAKANPLRNQSNRSAARHALRLHAAQAVRSTR